MNEQLAGEKQAGGFGCDLPMRAWIFTTIMACFNAGAVTYYISKLLSHNGAGIAVTIASVLILGLAAFTFGAVREGFRLERALIRARLEMVIGKLGG